MVVRVTDRASEFVGAADHIELGVIELPPFQISIRSQWGVQNTGQNAGRAAMKLTLIETKRLVQDETWLQFTPLAREFEPQGLVAPGITIDKLRSDVGSIGFSASFNAPDVGAGQSIAVTAGSAPFVQVTAPGFRVNAALEDFWTAHQNATFKVVVELLQVDQDWDFIESLGSHTFGMAFQVGSLQTQLSAVGEPTLRVLTL